MLASQLNMGWSYRAKITGDHLKYIGSYWYNGVCWHRFERCGQPGVDRLKMKDSELSILEEIA